MSERFWQRLRPGEPLKPAWMMRPSRAVCLRCDWTERQAGAEPEAFEALRRNSRDHAVQQRHKVYIQLVDLSDE